MEFFPEYKFVYLFIHKLDHLGFFFFTRAELGINLK